MQKLIREKTSVEAVNYFAQFIELEDKDTLVISTTNIFNILNHEKVNSILNLSRINNIRYVNKFFEEVNSKLDVEGRYIGCVETFDERKKRKKVNKIPVLRTVYFALEFIFLRVFPKVWGLKKIYFTVTRGRNRLLSKAEALGRLVSCGFEIIDYKHINGLLYFVVKKKTEPKFDMNPSYGLLYKMPRMGKNNKTIGVYKFRTMHPYAEYLHGYILDQNGYSESGKPADDFRLTPWGKFFRRYWLDELPQLLNVLKGELKLVGIRPVGERYFQDIPKELQELRKTQKPGCIPPYVSLNAKSDVESVQNAEKAYLIEKLKNPYFTDTKYFFKAIWNIVFKRKRSA
jgi:lipopolysaccharide/colanic/teichoic acid biosynthesis glycosyltransferase